MFVQALNHKLSLTRCASATICQQLLLTHTLDIVTADTSGVASIKVSVAVVAAALASMAAVVWS